MLGLLLVAFLVIPIAELAVIVQVADLAGILNTFVLLIAVSLAGAWLVRREGTGVWRRFNARIAAGEIPTDEVVNGLLILCAGALMLTPGFLTDAVGLLLLFPPSRALVRRTLSKRVASRVTFAAGPGASVFGTWPGRGGSADPRRRRSEDVWDVESWEDASGSRSRRELD